MKKFMNYAFLSAIAFAGALGFSGCSSSDDVIAENNPNYNPETDEVNVDFVFNVSTSNEATTRMSAANTQATLSQPFRGINNAYLGTFKLGSDGKFLTDATTEADKLHSLGNVIGAGKLNPNQEASGDVTQSRRVLQLSLESGTNSLLFWGKAIKNGTDIEQGKITMDVAKTPADTKFSMCHIVPETAYDGSDINQEMLGQYENLLASILTYIINSGVTGKEISYGGTYKTISLNWKDYVKVTGDAGSYKLDKPTKDPSDDTKDLSLLGERLSFTFLTLNTIHANELRAGCGQAVSDMMFDVMANINQVVNATPLNLEEVAAQEVAKEIKTRVELFFDAEHEYDWKDTDVVKDKATFVLTNDKNLVKDTYKLNNFPKESFNLPLGSVILQLDIATATSPATGYTYTYSYQGTVDTYAMGGTTGSATTAFDPKNYMYPAELCYFGNSPIRVTNETLVAGDYPDGVTNWDAESSWTSKKWVKNSHVTSATRSVAMQDNINYGTALLETKVRYSAQILEDNNKALQAQWTGATEENNTIDVSGRDDNFVLTGVLIGGQNPEVGWNYLAKTTSAVTGFGAMVYDQTNINIPKAEAAGGGNASAPTYTLLWDNWDVTKEGSKQRDVYVALEFKNNSRDFYGENNLIRNAATFYIVGKLDPDKKPASITDKTDEEYAADKSLGITWPVKYALPPYAYNSETKNYETIKERRVFMQDYMTKATFVIDKESLQHALVAVPDLRSGQISLGLSVDLEWRTGLNFGEVVLGK